MGSLDEATKLQQPGPGEPPTPDPRDAARGLPEDAPQAVVDQARGHDSPEGRRSAVKLLLGQQRAPRYKVRVEFATDEGDVGMWFLVHSLDGKRIDAIERAHTDRNSVMGEMDELSVNAELVADATLTISDGEPGTPEYEQGETTKVNSPEFLHGEASSAEALKARFHWQSGLLAGLATQIRRISGWAPDRVGGAQRVLVELAGNS